MKKTDAADAVRAVGNHVKLTTHEAFASGQLTGLTFADKLGDGALRMKKPGEAVFLSPVFETAKPFNDLVASWNTETPCGTWAEVWGRVYLPDYDGWTDRDGTTHDGWTDWITWGRWSTHIARSCPDCQDTHPRKDSEENNGWAYAYSKPGYGDSSLNTRGLLRLPAESGAPRGGGLPGPALPAAAGRHLEKHP